MKTKHVDCCLYGIKQTVASMYTLCKYQYMNN